MDSWNDELSRRTDEGFKEMREGFTRVDREMKAGFAQVASKEEVGEVRVEMRRVNDRLDKLMLVIFATCVGLFGTVFVGMLGLVLQA